MKHKLVIYGNNMYKEVDFDDSFAGSITIGTDKACQIAFRDVYKRQIVDLMEIRTRITPVTSSYKQFR